MTLIWIVLASLLGGVLSVLLAALIASPWLERWLAPAVSYAVGTLLGAAFLGLIPEAHAAGLEVEMLSALLLGGILLFFMLERAALWRHDHDTHDAHPHPAGLLIVAGDALHNFVDGILIAAAFLADTHLGIITTLAIVTHEIPQEIGDFMILIQAGYTRSRALMLNLAASLASLVGAVGGYLLLSQLQAIVPYVLALSAASFIYIAVADLVPQLHRHYRRDQPILQFALLFLGIALIGLQQLSLHHAH